MGNGVTKLIYPCFAVGRNRRIDSAAVTSEPLDDPFGTGLGHSFFYANSSSNHNNNYSISGASVSANPSTALSTSFDLPSSCHVSSSAAFDSSLSFSSYPLHPIPKFSGPLPDRGFLSGPLDRGFLSGPLDPRSAIFSGPLDVKRSNGNISSVLIPSSDRLKRSLSHGGRLIRNLSKKIGRSISVPAAAKISKKPCSSGGSSSSSVEIGEPDDVSSSLQWAQGRAGEDRVHVVVSEDHGWIFVGIYDGFNGPDATDYLLSNLYSAVQREVKGLLWVEEDEDWDKRERFSNGGQVLKAMSRALSRTEEEFFEVADTIGSENPELALMGSCVLAVLMKGEDVYVMNVGDSRAVLAQRGEAKIKKHDLGRISEEDGGEMLGLSTSLAALQLTLDHSTSVEEEVRRIKREHPDDQCAVVNDRVKGSLKVTRAFGAGFLKQPKWNNALLEMFRIDYVGTSPYITCNPFLYHHKLGPKDKFLMLSSDGLYQYFTNEEAVAQVESFIATTPEGDPAQHLVEEVIFRAAQKAGLDFHELLEIPQGDRRRYHDDVSIIVISFEGRIWRSCA